MAYRYLGKTEEKGNSASIEPKGVEDCINAPKG